MTGEVGNPAALLGLLDAFPVWAMGVGCGLILASALLWTWGRE